MTHKLEADVVVVGAGTSGCYLAWRLAQAGLQVLVLEKQCLADGGQAIDIFHMDEVRFDQFGLPHPEGEELIGHYPTGLAWSPQGDVLAASATLGTWLFDAVGFALTPRLLAVPNGPTHAAAFSPDGTLIASGSDDGVVFLWDVPR